MDSHWKGRRSFSVCLGFEVWGNFSAAGEGANGVVEEEASLRDGARYGFGPLFMFLPQRTIFTC